LVGRFKETGLWGEGVMPEASYQELKEELKKTIGMMIVAISCSWAGAIFHCWLFFPISFALCIPVLINLYKITVLRKVK